MRSVNPIAFSDPTGHASTKVIHDPKFIYPTAGVAVALGIFFSIVTFNPAPLALAIGTVVSAAGASTATVVAVHAGVLSTAAAITTAAKVVTWASFAAGFGVEGATMAAKDAKTQETMSWVGFGLNWVMLPSFKAIKAPVPGLLFEGSIKTSRSSSIASTSSSSSGYDADVSSLGSSRRSSSSSSSSSSSTATSADSVSETRIMSAARSRTTKLFDIEMQWDVLPPDFGFDRFQPASIPPPTSLPKSIEAGINASITQKTYVRNTTESSVLSGQEYFKGRQNSHKPKVVPPMAPIRYLNP
ncbi:hypothetical protein [Pseudomonas izuensis]|uniref:hypothetical protein n=1 Tax=Pseudomonas izuensis TaxID=2684212 RepID=UPI0013589306|nr:hypothetical protein [Pseudomonas izuensis]